MSLRTHLPQKEYYCPLSIVIALPSNTWVSDNRHTAPRRSRRDLPKDKHKTKKKRLRLSSISPLLDLLQLLTREAKDPRGQNINTKEEGIQHRLLLR